MESPRKGPWLRSAQDNREPPEPVIHIGIVSTVAGVVREQDFHPDEQGAFKTVWRDKYVQSRMAMSKYMPPLSPKYMPPSGPKYTTPSSPGSSIYAHHRTTTPTLPMMLLRPSSPRMEYKVTLQHWDAELSQPLLSLQTQPLAPETPKIAAEVTTNNAPPSVGNVNNGILKNGVHYWGNWPSASLENDGRILRHE